MGMGKEQSWSLYKRSGDESCAFSALDISGSYHCSLVLVVGIWSEMAYLSRWGNGFAIAELVDTAGRFTCAELYAADITANMCQEG